MSQHVGGAVEARIGLLAGVPPLEHSARAVEDLAAVEDLGFGAVWLDAWGGHPGGEGGEEGALLLAAALAGVTERVRIAIAAAPSATLHPLRLAEDLAMIDIASHGRLEWIPLRSHALTSAEHDEYVRIVVEAWRAEPFAHAGARWSFGELVCWPAPEQRPHPPLWLAREAARPDPADTGVTGTWITERSVLDAYDGDGDDALAVLCRLDGRADSAAGPDRGPQPIGWSASEASIRLPRDPAACREALAGLRGACRSGWLIVDAAAAPGTAGFDPGAWRWLADEVLRG